MQILSKHYIVGLVDGEGSFTAYVHNFDQSSSRKRRARIEPRFSVKLIARDKKILYALKDYFRCGNVYFQRDTRANHQQCYRFEVANREDLWRIIIPFFKKNHLQFPSKLHDFKIFFRIMERIREGEHLTDSGLQRLYQLKQKMH